MGILRFVFATIILVAHVLTVYSTGKIVLPTIAASSFYVISGFYMSLVLNEKYIQKHTYWVFLWNRLLRIFPVYWIVLVLLIIFSIGKQVIHPGSETLLIHAQHIFASSPFEFINYVLRNITLILTSDYVFKTDNTEGYLILVQTPPLQSELLFYLVAPWITRLKKRAFIFVLIGYGFLTFVLHYTIFPQTLTQVFLHNLLFFMLGIISYKLYLRVKKVHISNKNVGLFSLWFCFGIIVLHILVYGKMLSFSSYILWIYFSVLVLAIPLLFKWENKQSIFLGELSYPVYLVHFLVVKMIMNLSHNLSLPFVLLASFLTTVILSWLLHQYVQKPIDRFRKYKRT